MTIHFDKKIIKELMELHGLTIEEAVDQIFSLSKIEVIKDFQENK